MVEFIAFIVSASIIAFVVAIALMIVVGCIQAAAALLGAIANLLNLTPRRGKHAPDADEPVSKVREFKPVVDGDGHGWEPDEVDTRTGEVKSFVWRGSRE